MRIPAIILVLVAAGSLSACTPTERTLGGAAVGAVVADDALTGAVVGGALGAVSCGIPGLPRCR